MLRAECEKPYIELQELKAYSGTPKCLLENGGRTLEGVVVLTYQEVKKTPSENLHSVKSTTLSSPT